jgi:hypothetical protein
MPTLPTTLGPLNIPRAANGIPRVDTASAVGIRAQGTQALLQGLSNAAGTAQQAVDTNDLANAQSQFLQAKVQQDNSYQDDTDWATIPDRYNAAVGQARQSAADQIRNPVARNQFLRESQLDVMRGGAQISQLAKSKESDQGRADLTVNLNNNLQSASMTADTATRAKLLQTMGQQVDAAVLKGYVDAEGGARLKVDYGNKYIAQRQRQLGVELGSKLDTIIGNASANPDMNANVKAIDDAAAQYQGSLPPEDLTTMVTKAKNQAFENALGSDNLSVSRGFQILNGKQQLDAVPRQMDPTPQLMDSVVSRGEFGRTGDRNPASGALGKYQLMPAVARVLAERRGIPYDEHALQYVDSYGATLAGDLMKELLTRYQGDVTMAVAAYNANPSAVDDWARQFGDPRKGETTDAEWAAAIPYDETREYVRRVVPPLAQRVGVAGTQVTDNPVLNAAVKQYPRLAKYAQNTVLVEKPNPTGDDRMLESFPPWESENPNPGKQTTELYTQGTTEQKGNLVAGDLLHYIGGIDQQTGKPVDPQFHAMKEELIKSLTPEQLKGEHAYYDQTRGAYGDDTRTFDQWMESSRGDELVMGYLTPDQNDSFKHYYSPQQKGILGRMKSYMQQSDDSDSVQAVANVTALGGDPAMMPRYQSIIDAKRNRQDAQNQAQWAAQNQKLADSFPDHIASIVATGKGTINLNDWSQSLPPEKMAVLQQKEQAAYTLNGVVQPIVSGTTQEAQGALAKLEPQAGDPDYQTKQEAYSKGLELFGKRVEGLQKDPAAYVQQNDAVAADAAAELDSLDLNDPEQATQARVDVDTVRQAQRRLGVPDDQIKPLTEAKASQLGTTLMTAEPDKVTATLDNVTSTFGADGLRQVLSAKGVSPSMRYIAYMDNPADAVLRARAVIAAQQPHDDLVAGMKGKQITEDQVRTQVQSITDPALAQRPGWGAYEDGMVNTTMYLVNQGMPLSQAATAAYAPWKRGFNFPSSQTYSIPATLDATKVQSGLDGVIANLSSFDIDPKGGGPAGLSRNWTKEQSVKALQMGHVWTNLPDDSGVVLSYDPGDGQPGDPVMLSGGKRLIVKFSDAESGIYGRNTVGHYPRAGGPPIPPTQPVRPGAPDMVPPVAPSQPVAPQAPIAPTQPQRPKPPVRPVPPTAPGVN